jgi:DMSO/TMAO reductase YedYZ molybdopterin-dependent catalytic subunit
MNYSATHVEVEGRNVFLVYSAFHTLKREGFMATRILMTPKSILCKAVYNLLGTWSAKNELETWRLLVTELVENELILSFRDLQRLPQVALRDFLR